MVAERAQRAAIQENTRKPKKHQQMKKTSPPARQHKCYKSSQHMQINKCAANSTDHNGNVSSVPKKVSDPAGICLLCSGYWSAELLVNWKVSFLFLFFINTLIAWFLCLLDINSLNKLNNYMINCET